MCYCKGDRSLGWVEFQCRVCRQWFHLTCSDTNLVNVPPFMVTYLFECKSCHPQSEIWELKRENFVHSVITAFAIKHREKELETGNYEYIDLEMEIVPFMEENWDMLTTIKKRRALFKDLIATVSKFDKIFEQKPGNTDKFGLIEKGDLELISPYHPAIISIGKRTTKSKPAASTTPLQPSKGSKRKPDAVRGVVLSKKRC